MKLVIFDLDQTVVDFIPLHDETMERFFLKKFGVKARLSDTDFAGKGLDNNLIELARLKGLPEEKVKGEDVIREYERLFAGAVPKDGSKFILPGVKDLLYALTRTDNLVVLYTGSSPGIIDAVMKSTGLGRYFKFCLSSTQAKSRADMVRQAIERAQQLAGKEFQGKDIVIIGDAVIDIECGKLFNALTIAVATGFHPEEKLSSRHPDYIFPNLKDYQKVLKAIES
ncbi:MAG: HAD family hydrolase [Dehalococcoidales bacterium]|nr:HAD family hydrolase [Dehalococcoidales bacterium]